MCACVWECVCACVRVCVCVCVCVYEYLNTAKSKVYIMDSSTSDNTRDLLTVTMATRNTVTITVIYPRGASLPLHYTEHCTVQKSD